MNDYRPFKVEIDHAKESVTIQGIRYAFSLFDNLGWSAEGHGFGSASATMA